MLRKVINYWPFIFIFYILIFLFLNFQKSISNDENFLDLLTNKDYNYFDLSILFLSLILNIASVFIVSLVVYLGFYIANIPFDLKNIFVSNLFSNYIFFIPIVLELTFEIDGLKKSFSIYSLLFDNSMSTWLSYPLISLNLFELFYILIFSFFLSKFYQRCFDDNLKIVLLSYGGIFFLWIAVILFISIK